MFKSNCFYTGKYISYKICQGWSPGDEALTIQKCLNQTVFTQQLSNKDKIHFISNCSVSICKLMKNNQANEKYSSWWKIFIQANGKWKTKLNHPKPVRGARRQLKKRCVEKCVLDWNDYGHLVLKHVNIFILKQSLKFFSPFNSLCHTF